jgi:hypothetical protein
LSVQEALYCNYMSPTHCKEMGIITPTITQMRLQGA